jgi:hypothetical protein
VWSLLRRGNQSEIVGKRFNIVTIGRASSVQAACWTTGFFLTDGVQNDTLNIKYA